VWDIKYRPRVFGDVLGQEGPVQVLKQRLKNGTALDTSYIFSGGHGRGKCVSKETLVPTNRGLLEIGDLMGGPHVVDPVHIVVGQEQGVGEAAFSYRGGVRDTVRIKTSLGFFIEGTPHHRIKILAKSGEIEWREIGQVRKGDYACLSRGTGLFGTGPLIEGYSYAKRPHDHSSHDFNPPTTLSLEWARLLGYLAGDGSCTSRTSVSVHTAEPDTVDDARRLLDRLGGGSFISPDKRRPGLVAVRCSSVQFRDFLAFLGVSYAKAGGKEMPWSIRVSPEHLVCEFLRGYFECDGSVSGYRVEALTKSPKLARQVQAMLLNLGVVAYRRPKPHPEYGVYWRVGIRRSSLDVFASKVGFLSARKRGQLQRSLVRGHAKGRRQLSNTYEVVPYQAAHLRFFYESLSSELRTHDTSHFFQARRGRVSCTDRQVQRIVSEFKGCPGYAHFKHLLDTGYYFDPVIETSPGRAEVFDLSVPGQEMFAAGGFMNHNTTLARILARALLCQDLQGGSEPCNSCDNCQAQLTEASVAYKELDAASSGTIDNVRRIVDELAFNVPGAAKRVIVFDEMHRMSRDSQDVLLKPIEDKRFVAILCTTEGNKIRSTIRSRCEEHIMRPITRDDVQVRLRKILEAEKVEYEDDALLVVIDHSQGHVRDILNKLEMIAQLGPVSLESARTYLRLDAVTQYYKVLLSLGQPGEAARIVDDLCGTLDPDDVAAGLAEAAMNSYRLAYKMHAPFSLMDRGLAKQVYSLFKDNVTKLAEYFLRVRHVTKAGLVCDVVALSGGGGIPQTAVVPSQPMVLQVVAPLALPPSPVEATAPISAPVASAEVESEAPEQESPKPPPPLAMPAHGRPDGIGSLGSNDFAALTTLDEQGVPHQRPRGHERKPPPQVEIPRQSVPGGLRLLPPTEWRRAHQAYLVRTSSPRSDAN